ncbi:MAG: hypothetical protein QOC70_1535 [Verrucomicrobiota bacterium]|jgi:hypothetical protein
MTFYAGELGFRPGEVVFDGNGHLYSSHGSPVAPSGPSEELARRSVNALAAFGRQFASSNDWTRLANTFNYGVAFPAAGAAAAPVIGYGVLVGANVYLTNPVFWNGLAGAAVPSLVGMGGGTPMNMATNPGQAIGQAISLLLRGFREIGH